MLEHRPVAMEWEWGVEDSALVGDAGGGNEVKEASVVGVETYTLKVS